MPEECAIVAIKLRNGKRVPRLRKLFRNEIRKFELITSNHIKKLC